MDSPTRRKSGKVIITIKAGINKEKLKNCFMKRNLLLSGLFVAAFFCGCADDISDGGDNKGVANPVKEGSEILFGSSLSTDVDDIMSKASRIETRTVYGDRTESGVPVYWAPEGDEVAIFCAQASQPASRLVNYIVKPQTTNPYVSESVTKVNPAEAGLQWGSADEHRFYAFYPASAVKAADADDQDGVITASIPVNQMPESWREGEINGVKTYFGLPNMDYAYMYAFSTYKKSQTEEGTAIDLQFKNLVTVLDITVQGPEGGEPIEVSNINVTAVGGQNVILTGDFNCNIRTADPNSEEVTAKCTAAGDLNAVRNNISIPCYDKATRKFIKLGPGEQLNVKAYLIPDDEASHDALARQFQITVATMNATKKRTLTNLEIEPHKINRVRLDNLVAGGTNYWMSSLDRDIYLSELSIPGSKFAYLTSANTGGKAAFQGAHIEQQFLDGVRAFIVQVGANATYGRSGRDRSIQNATLPIYCGDGDNLEDAVKLIANALQTAEDELTVDKNLECAVVMLTSAGNEHISTNYTPSGGKDEVWMDAIAYKLKALGADPANRIYTDEITANTTLDDVKGKIVFKVNTNEDAQANYLSATETVPALFSRWNGAMNTVPLRWGTLNSASTRPALNWMYQEATHVGDNTEITATNKIAYIETVFTNSVDAYQNNAAHDTWFMNDCGGTFHYSVTGAGDYDGNYGDGDQNSNNPIALSRWINPQVTDFLQQRAENASLGLVFFNFADKQENSGVQYGTNYLIQTIIDNNFKFALRKAGESGTTTNSSDASYSEGGTVWR